MKQRQTWFDGQTDLDPDRLVFIDETWASTNMLVAERSVASACRGSTR